MLPSRNPCSRSFKHGSTRSISKRAAYQALGGQDLGQVIELAERALGSTTDREARGRILWVQAEAHRWRGEMTQALEKSARASDLLPPGTVDFYFALGEAIASCAF